MYVACLYSVNPLVQLAALPAARGASIVDKHSAQYTSSQTWQPSMLPYDFPVYHSCVGAQEHV